MPQAPTLKEVFLDAMERVTHGLYEWSCEPATGEKREGRWGLVEYYTCIQLNRPAVPDMTISTLKVRMIRALNVKKERSVRNSGGLKIGEEREGSKDKRIRENGQVGTSGAAVS